MNQNHHLAKYFGELRNGRMHGHGSYWFDTGTRYVGEFRDDAFHGKGTLYFKNGGKYEGIWKNGIETKGEYVFSDGLKCDLNDWSYCTEHDDRRFYPEHVNGLNPSDRCLIGAQSDQLTGKPLKYVPDYCYDTGDGVYDPTGRIVYQYGENEEKPLGDFIRNATDEEHIWIVMHCRKGWDEFVGFQGKLT